MSIEAIRVHLTFRIKKLESTNGASSILYLFLNFISNFTNISDAEVFFDNLDIRNTYNTQDNVQRRLINHYIKQGAS